MTEAERDREYVTKNCRLADFDQRTSLDLVVHDFIGEGRGIGKGDFSRALRVKRFRQIAR